MGIRDVWRCFKKDRKNKYNAVILGGEDLEECPSNYLLQLNTKILLFSKKEKAGESFSLYRIHILKISRVCFSVSI